MMSSMITQGVFSNVCNAHIQNDAQVDQSHVVHVVTWVQRVKTAHVENVGKIVMGKNIQIKRYLIPIHILIIQVKDFLH